METGLKDDSHVLLVTFPAQGHINPSLQFSKRLVKLGVKVTFCTSLTAFNRISKLPTIEGLTFAPFSDGYDGSFSGSMDDFPEFWSSFITLGSEFVANLFKAREEEGRPFTRIIYTTLMAWVGLVAKSINAPATFLWIQPVTVLDIYYYYFSGYADSFKNCSKDQPLELPGLPLLTPRDLPTLIIADSKTKGWAIPTIKDHVELMNNETNPRVLVNTFDALEPDALRALEKVTMVGIGPFVPSAFLDGNDPSDTSFGADLRQISTDYVDWLDSKAASSVIYIAFGSYSELPNQLMEEIAQGLLLSERPFLWVLRESPKGEKTEEKISCKEELKRLGKIVSWCSQVEVLQHPSLACFLTHCGWNSTLESLVSGVPVVACPLWTDQACNAKLIEDVWKTGVRVEANDEGIIERDEFKRCIEIVAGEGERGGELRKNAKKWRDSAKDAMKEGGSSMLNLQAYVQEVLHGEASAV